MKNTFASFSQSDTSENDIFASALLVLIIFPVSVMFVLISTKTSQRLQHESEFRNQIPIMAGKLEISKSGDYNFEIPYLHIRDEIIWVDISESKEYESQYAKRFDAVFYEYRIQSVMKLIPLFYFVMYFAEGFVLGIVDFHSNETALWCMVVMYTAHLLVLILVFPSILKSDNMWRIFRVVMTLVILFIAYVRSQECSLHSIYAFIHFL